ncbi:MAG: class I SAM-dependent DNA methyltransferase [Polyangiales bacterium]
MARAKTSKPAKKAAAPELPLVDGASTLTAERLKNHLWEAANILRGPVDAADFKTYIFPLLFFKRICDVWDDETKAAVEEFGDASFAEAHRFQVPEGAHWRDVRAITKKVGAVLQKALQSVERANQGTLYGVFGDAQWTNTERLSDALLCDLIEHFSALSLGDHSVESDLLGDAYEYLIKKFADATNKKAGEFYTPRSVVRLMIDLLDPREGETVYDPACGTGGMLLAAVEHVRARGGDPRRFFGKLYGQEKNLTTSAIARMNLFLHGVEDFQVVRGDTLRNPAFYDAGKLADFDVVIANPPFSLEKWGDEVWAKDPWQRNFAGLPPASSGDFAWVQHMVTSMAPKTGRMAVVLPQGALFRGGVEGAIRQKILQRDLIEAVIGLAPNLFYGTGLAACVLVLRHRKAKERRGKVLFVDASDLFRKGRAQNTLEPEHAAEIEKTVRAFRDVAHRAKVATLEDIAALEGTLNIPRYVTPAPKEEVLPLPEAVARFKDALARARDAEERLAKLLEDEGWLS